MKSSGRDLLRDIRCLDIEHNYTSCSNTTHCIGGGIAW